MAQLREQVAQPRELVVQLQVQVAQLREQVVQHREEGVQLEVQVAQLREQLLQRGSRLLTYQFIRLY